MICHRLAPYTRLTVTSSRGTDCTEAMPPTISTKIVVNTPKAIFWGMLTPNIRMNTGRKIDLGTPKRKLTRGRNSAPSTGTSARVKPMRSPTGTAMRKAANASQAVTPRLVSTSGRFRRRISASRIALGAGARLASSRPRRASASQRPKSPRTKAATMARSCRRIAPPLRLGRADRHVHEHVGGRCHVLHPARGGQLHGFLHRGERHLPVAGEAQEGLLVLHPGDLDRQLVVGGDGLDRVVRIVAHVLELPVEGVQALLDEGAPLGEVLLG